MRISTRMVWSIWKTRGKGVVGSVLGEGLGESSYPVRRKVAELSKGGHCVHWDGLTPDLRYYRYNKKLSIMLAGEC